MAPRATAGDEIVVVTGAAGFLGTKVVELLNTKGQNIVEIRGFDICHQKPPCFLQSYDGCGKVILRYSQGGGSTWCKTAQNVPGHRPPLLVL